MPWIIFDEEDRRIPAPRFCLEAAGGEPVCVDDYCEDCSLVLVFPRSGDCEDCLKLLHAFAERVRDYATVDGQILALLPWDSGELRTAGLELELPFPVLADAGAQVRRAYAGLMDESLVNEDDSMIFVLDAYCAPYSAYVGSDPEIQNPGLHDDVLSWLEFIGVQCPE